MLVILVLEVIEVTDSSDEYSHSGGQRKIEADCNVGSIRIKMEV